MDEGKSYNQKHYAENKEKIAEKKEEKQGTATMAVAIAGFGD